MTMAIPKKDIEQTTDIFVWGFKKGKECHSPKAVPWGIRGIGI
jgi:hypothetical protein